MASKDQIGDEQDLFPAFRRPIPVKISSLGLSNPFCLGIAPPAAMITT